MGIWILCSNNMHKYYNIMNSYLVIIFHICHIFMARFMLLSEKMKNLYILFHIITFVTLLYFLCTFQFTIFNSRHLKDKVLPRATMLHCLKSNPLKARI